MTAIPLETRVDEEPTALQQASIAGQEPVVRMATEAAMTMPSNKRTILSDQTRFFQAEPFRWREKFSQGRFPVRVLLNVRDLAGVPIDRRYRHRSGSTVP